MFVVCYQQTVAFCLSFGVSLPITWKTLLPHFQVFRLRRTYLLTLIYVMFRDNFKSDVMRVCVLCFFYDGLTRQRQTLACKCEFSSVTSLTLHHFTVPSVF